MSKQSQMNARLALLFFAGFLLILFAAVRFGFQYWYSNHHDPRPNSIGAFSSDLQKFFTYDVSIMRPQDAKSRKLFWYHEENDVGIALAPAQNPNLVKALFPGYPREMAHDDDLWADYFSHEFNPDSQLFAFDPLSRKEFRIKHSLAGCLDVYKRYGADVIVFGNSEVASNILPDLLSDKLQSLKKPKVLLCVSSGMPPSLVTHWAQILGKLRPVKPKLVIWGYSYWFAYTRSKNTNSFSQELQKAVENYTNPSGPENQPSLFESLHSYKVAKMFPAIDWGSVLPFSYQKMMDFKNSMQEIENAEQRKSANTAVAINQEGGEVPGSLAARENELEQFIVAKFKPYYHFLEGVTAQDCNLKEAPQIFKQTVTALSELADNVFIYLPPTTDLHTRSAPDCFYQNVKNMLQSARGPKVHVKADPASSYALAYSDYLFATEDPRKKHLNINHPNYTGSLKVTSRISDWVIEHMQPESLVKK